MPLDLFIFRTNFVTLSSFLVLFAGMGCRLNCRCHLSVCFSCHAALVAASPFLKCSQKFIQCYLALCDTLFIFILNIFLCFQSVEKMTREGFYDGWN